jgi:hypothetical protein
VQDRDLDTKHPSSGQVVNRYVIHSQLGIEITDALGHKGTNGEFLAFVTETCAFRAELAAVDKSDFPVRSHPCRMPGHRRCWPQSS